MKNRRVLPFKKLLAAGYVKEGQTLYLDEPATEATVTKNAKLKAGKNNWLHS